MRERYEVVSCDGCKVPRRLDVAAALNAPEGWGVFHSPTPWKSLDLCENCVARVLALLADQSK